MPTRFPCRQWKTRACCDQVEACGVSVHAVKEFSARAALTFVARQRPQNPFSIIQMYEVVDGVKTYVQALARDLGQTELKCGTDIRAIRRESGQFVLTETTGISHCFDHLILAVPAHEALTLISGLAGIERCREAVAGFSYANTRMAVHTDLKYMPARRRDWSFFNVMSDVSHARASFWPGRATNDNVFRSWVTEDDRLPRDIHGLYPFAHPLMTPTYFKAQKRLAAEQGRGNLWFVGSYTRDIDSHESALLSALEVAQKIGPQSARSVQISQASRSHEFAD